MKKFFLSVLTVCLALVCLSMTAQNSTPQPQKPSTQPPASSPPAISAQPGDVDTVDHIVAAVYDVISGPAGQRDWDRFRSLYYPGARMIPTRRDDKGSAVARVSTTDEYAARSQEFFSKEGFFENSVANRVEIWDKIAHVWSTYESRHAKGEKPFARGINSFQLFNDGNRWWILTVYWESETPGNPLPEKYLK
jgi:hypothetical protein